MTYKPIDLTGLKFGRLTVVERVENSKGKWPKPRYLCKCDCGNLTTVSAGNLRSTHVKSCGCLMKEIRQKTSDRAAENLENTAAKAFVKSYKRSALYRGLEWGLLNEEALNLALQDCHYCSSPPSRPAKTHQTRKRKHIKRNYIRS